MKSDLMCQTEGEGFGSNNGKTFLGPFTALPNSLKKNGLEISLQPAHRGFSGFLSFVSVPAPGRRGTQDKSFGVTKGGLGVV